MKHGIGLLVVTVALALCGCGGDSSASSPVPGRLGRTVAIDVSSGKNETYEAAFDLVKVLGVDEVKLSFDWNQIETASGFDFTFVDIANQFYPAKSTPLTLVLRPINTNRTTLPADLVGKAFDDTAVITRFEAFLTAIHARMQNITFVRVHVGNEVDGYLGTSSSAWAAYTTFFKAARSKVRQLFGNIPVGCITQWSGMTNPATRSLVQALNSNADVVAVNYYPLQSDFTVRAPSTVAGDFKAVVDLYPLGGIVFQECGYPSGALCKSSEALQEQFVREVFRVWDNYATRIEHIDFAWQTDADQAAVNQWAIDYGVAGQPGEAVFKEYLATLGLRRSDGSSRPAWAAMGQEMARRGW